MIIIIDHNEWQYTYRFIYIIILKLQIYTYEYMNVCVRFATAHSHSVYGNRLIYASNQIWHNCNFNYQAVNFVCNVGTLRQTLSHL